MHSSCIVVRLDWAAGLPAWLIRSFGSPGLTRQTLFSSQKRQSHSSWDLNVVISSLEIQCGKYMIIPLISSLCWDHDHKLAGKPVLVSAMAEAENWRLSVRLAANGLGLCEPLLQPDYTHSSISVTQDWFHTSAKHIQCFSPRNRNIH